MCVVVGSYGRLSLDVVGEGCECLSARGERWHFIATSRRSFSSDRKIGALREYRLLTFLSSEPFDTRSSVLAGISV